MFPDIRACNDLEILCQSGQTSTDGTCNEQRGSRLSRRVSFGADITYGETVASYVNRSRPARPVPLLPMKFADEDVSGLNIKPQNDVYSESIKRRTDSIKSKIIPGVNTRHQSVAFQAEPIYGDASGLNIISHDVYSAVEPYQICQMLEKTEPNYE